MFLTRSKLLSAKPKTYTMYSPQQWNKLIIIWWTVSTVIEICECWPDISYLTVNYDSLDMMSLELEEKCFRFVVWRKWLCKRSTRNHAKEGIKNTKAVDGCVAFCRVLNNQQVLSELTGCAWVRAWLSTTLTTRSRDHCFSWNTLNMWGFSEWFWTNFLHFSAKVFKYYILV